jgi:hypothetical protein
MTTTPAPKPSKGSNIHAAVTAAKRALIDGTALIIDPSIGSRSSMPGYAVYVAGKLTESGTLRINPDESKWERLREVHRQLRNISKLHDPDVLVYEDVPVTAHGGRSQVSHASLLMAVGAALAAVDCPHVVPMPPSSWKRWARPEYEKGDEADAVEIGWVTIEMAKNI